MSLVLASSSAKSLPLFPRRAQQSGFMQLHQDVNPKFVESTNGAKVGSAECRIDHLHAERFNEANCFLAYIIE
jgi:hypothetical protein